MTFNGESSSPSGVEGVVGPSHEEVRAQLERILVNRDFEATERMRDFLCFVVEETLAERGKRLKGYTIATKVFGRGKDFDPSGDPIVRIQAGKLRRALERYYLMAGGRDPIRIDIPKGRYIPRFIWQKASRTRVSDGPAVAAWDDRGTDRPTIAILPLTTATGGEDIFFVNGLVTELANELNRYQDILALPCQEVVPVAGGGIALRDVSQEMGARFLLGGTVRRDPSRMKTTVQLTDGTTGRQIWSQAYSIDLGAAHLIETQEEIARTVIAAIAGEYGVIARRISSESRSKPPAELTTYDALLRYHHYMLVMTPEAGEAAFSALQLATKEEPEYAPSWSGLATLHCHALVFDRPGMKRPLEVATAYARKAAALDPRNQMARTILAWVYLLRGEMTQFWSEAEAALALNPNSPNFSGTIGYLLACAGDFEGSRQLLDQAIALNPCHPKWFHHGLYLIHFARSDYDEAYREALQIGFTVGPWDPTLRAAVLAKLGRENEARAAAREILENQPDFEMRIREILSHTCKPTDLREGLLDGLRQAGLRID